MNLANHKEVAIFIWIRKFNTQYFKSLATPGDPLFQVTLVSIVDVPYRLLCLLLLYMGQFCCYVTFKWSVIFEFRKEIPQTTHDSKRIKRKIMTSKYLWADCKPRLYMIPCHMPPEETFWSVGLITVAPRFKQNFGINALQT